MGRGYFIMSKVNPLYKTVKILNSDDNLAGLFQYNQFSEQIEFTRDFFLCESQKANMPLIDEDIIQLRYYLSRVHDWEPNKGIVGECCYLLSHQKQYLEFWKVTFSQKGFRNDLFNSLIPIFEEKTNNYLKRFNMECIVKLEGVRKDIGVYIIDKRKKNKKAVEFSTFSGGEKNKISFSCPLITALVPEVVDLMSCIL
jgi:hypothetical protein